MNATRKGASVKPAAVVETLASVGIALASVVFVATTATNWLGYVPSAAPRVIGAETALEDVKSANFTIALRPDEAGGRNGQMAVVEFSDFECPYCASFARTTVAPLKQQLVDTDTVRYLFRHFPLDSIHPLALAAATAAECARRDGKFWELHDLLFQAQRLSNDGIAKHTESIGLSGSAFSNCLSSQETRDVISRDVADGRRVGVQGTPTLFIGAIQDNAVRLLSRVVGDRSLQSLLQAIAAVQSEVSESRGEP